MDESNCDKFSLDSLSSNNERKVVIKNGRKKEDTRESLRDNKKRILLDDNMYILKLVWKKDTSGYL